MRAAFMKLRLYRPVLSVEPPRAWALSPADVSALLVCLLRLWTKEEKARKAVFSAPFVTKENGCF